MCALHRDVFPIHLCVDLCVHMVGYRWGSSREVCIGCQKGVYNVEKMCKVSSGEVYRVSERCVPYTEIYILYISILIRVNI